MITAAVHARTIVIPMCWYSGIFVTRQTANLLSFTTAQVTVTITLTTGWLINQYALLTIAKPTTMMAHALFV